jgi:hypothetical protein
MELVDDLSTRQWSSKKLSSASGPSEYLFLSRTPDRKKYFDINYSVSHNLFAIYGKKVFQYLWF